MYSLYDWFLQAWKMEILMFYFFFQDTNLKWNVMF